MMKFLFSFFLFLVSLVAISQSSYEIGVNYFEKEAYEQAKLSFKSYLEQHPNDKATREYLGDIAGYAKEWDTAISYYEPLVNQDDSNANYHFKLGGAIGMKALEMNRIRAIGYIGDIREHFERAAQLDPKHIEARWALVEFYIQLPAIIGGSEKKAIVYANQLTEISPVDGHLAKGYIAEYNNRPKDAEQHYKMAIKTGGSVHTYNKLTTFYEDSEQPEKALRNAQNCLQEHDRNSLHYQIGKIAAQYNLDPELGINCLHKYIKNHSVKDGVPKDWAYYRLAQIYKNMGEKDSALQWIERALSKRPNFKEAKKEKALILSL